MRCADRCRWTLWLLYALAWTAALLTTFPLEARGTIVPTEAFFSVGKTLHVSAYAVFAILTSWLPLSAPGRRLSLLLVIAHAPLTEFVQQFVGRECSLADVGFDLAGVTMGIAVTLRRWKEPRTSPPADSVSAREMCGGGTAERASS